MLKVSDIDVNYGKLEVLHKVSFEVKEGEIVTLLGSNGAGKTTTLKTISGLLSPAKGYIELMGQKISGLRADRIVRLGVSHSPEGRRIFPEMTVYENLVVMGAYLRRDKEGIQTTLQEVYELFPILKERQKQRAGTLSGGQQQMLAIGRALMNQPKLLMLDEPSLGLAPLLVRDLAKRIRDIRARGTTILLVEQNARMAMSIADKAYVLETGRIVLEGDTQKLMHDESVRKAYLGI